MQALQVIELIAGYDPNNQPVIERLQVKVEDDGVCQLVRSPAFIKGIASGDRIRLSEGQFTIVRRSGNLCIRVMAKDDISVISDQLSPVLEKLGGELDIETPRMLVYSIHVSCGFQQIESLLNDVLADHQQALWVFGNVYDPVDGTTPLNWWQEFLSND